MSREGWNDGTWNSATGTWGHGLEEEVSVPDARVSISPADDRDGQISGDSSGLYVHSGGSDYPVIASFAQDVASMTARMTGDVSGSSPFVDRVADVPVTVDASDHVHSRPIFFVDTSYSQVHGSSGSTINTPWYRSSGNHNAGYVSGSHYVYIPYDGWWLLGLDHHFNPGSDAGQRLATLVVNCASAPSYWGTAGRNDMIELAGATDSSLNGTWHRSGLWLGKLKQNHPLFAQSYQNSGGSRTYKAAMWGVWMGPWDSTMSWDGFH